MRSHQCAYSFDALLHRQRHARWRPHNQHRAHRRVGTAQGNLGSAPHCPATHGRLRVLLLTANRALRTNEFYSYYLGEAMRVWYPIGGSLKVVFALCSGRSAVCIAINTSRVQYSTARRSIELTEPLEGPVSYRAVQAHSAAAHQRLEQGIDLRCCTV